MSASGWFDSPQRYGLITRLLHWSIAMLPTWQCAGMLVKITVGKHAVTAFMVGSHKPIGTILMLLIAAPALWAFSQWKQRPRHPDNWLGKAATAGHAMPYVLMLYIPAVALLRQFGSDQAFAPFGIPLFPGRPHEIAWMQAPADASHSTLAWMLLAAIVVHVLMVAMDH